MAFLLPPSLKGAIPDPKLAILDSPKRDSGLPLFTIALRLLISEPDSRRAMSHHCSVGLSCTGFAPFLC